jgi:hypothetical protein
MNAAQSRKLPRFISSSSEGTSSRFWPVSGTPATDGNIVHGAASSERCIAASSSISMNCSAASRLRAFLTSVSVTVCSCMPDSGIANAMSTPRAFSTATLLKYIGAMSTWPCANAVDSAPGLAGIALRFGTSFASAPNPGSTLVGEPPRSLATSTRKAVPRFDAGPTIPTLPLFSAFQKSSQDLGAATFFGL